MGPLAGIGDTLFLVIPTTIIVLSLRTSRCGQPVGLVLWLLFALFACCLCALASERYQEGVNLLGL